MRVFKLTRFTRFAIKEGKNRKIYRDISGMSMKKKYQSEQLMVCHESAQALYEIGAITEVEMRQFDEDCLVPEPAAKAVSPAYARRVYTTNRNF
jgi:hypothetical protein